MGEARGDDAPAQKEKKKEDADEELSEEDRELKERFNMLADRVIEETDELQRQALETIRSEIRSSTSSMTSVPKPLKFLRPHYGKLKEQYAKMEDGGNKLFMADVLSVLAMTMAEESSLESLHFKLAGSEDQPYEWGHEYVRHLCGEIGQEYAQRMEKMQGEEESVGQTWDIGDLMRLVESIVPFLVSSNAESEACDLLMEVDALPKIIDIVDEKNYERVCLYLISCAKYVTEPEQAVALDCACQLYHKAKQYPQAMRLAMKRNQPDLIEFLYNECDDPVVKKQLCFDLAKQGMFIDSEEDDDLRLIMSNGKLHDHYQLLAKDLEVLEPKTPEDIYKSHLVETRQALATHIDSARQNLASTYVNAFVNLGFGSDKLMLDDEMAWIRRNKEHGMMSVTASLGMLMLWDVENVLSKAERYMHSKDDHVRAGALLAVGVASAGVRNEFDAALALLRDHVEGSVPIRCGMICGLGIAYAGTNNEDVLEVLRPIITDTTTGLDVFSLAALSLGLVFVGSGNERIATDLIDMLMVRAEDAAGFDELGVIFDPLLVYVMPLALGLLYYGQPKGAHAVSYILANISGPLSKACALTLDALAHAGSGNVLKVQKLFEICGEHPAAKQEEASAAAAAAAAAAPSSSSPSSSAPATGDGGGQSAPAGGSAAGGSAGADKSVAKGGASRAEAGGANSASAAAGSAGDGGGAGESKAESDDKAALAAAAVEQRIATLSIAVVAMGDEIGCEMALRIYGHVLQYSDPPVRRAVPLALGLLSISNPQLSVTDTLSKLTHDADQEVAQAAILGLGLIGAGTNNSRIAALLRQLSSYYGKEPSHLFTVRIAQGLLHAGKGLVTLSPEHTERNLIRPVALGGLLTVLFASLDMNGTIHGKFHYLLYFLALAVRPRMVFPVDEELNPVPVNIRVGQAVDTVGQAGRPKSITGFQTHTAPVLLGAGERAELAADEYSPVTNIFDGCILLKKHADAA